MHWFEIAVAAIIGSAGCAAIYAIITRAMRRAAGERATNTEEQLNALADKVKALEARVAEMGSLNPGPASPSEIEPEAGVRENMGGEEGEQLTPEALAVVAAAATTFIGKKARIRAAHAIPAADGAGEWAQQGRVLVQTSHNLRPRT
jgi:hypothetical protein